MRGSAARHKTLCAIDQAHCEVQKAQSRVARPAAGDLRRADHGAFTTGKMAFRCDLRRAECLTQRASGESLGVIPPAKGYPDRQLLARRIRAGLRSGTIRGRPALAGFG